MWPKPAAESSQGKAKVAPNTKFFTPSEKCVTPLGKASEKLAKRARPGRLAPRHRAKARKRMLRRRAAPSKVRPKPVKSELSRTTQPCCKQGGGKTEKQDQAQERASSLWQNSRKRGEAGSPGPTRSNEEPCPAKQRSD